MKKRKRLPKVSVLVTDQVPFQVEARQQDVKRRRLFNHNIVPIANQLMELFNKSWDDAKREAMAEYEMFGHQFFINRGGILV